MGSKHTSLELRNLVIQKFLNNYSQKRISEDLCLSKYAVHRIIAAYKMDGRVAVKRRSGRPPKSSQKSQRMLCRLSVICPKMTSRDLKVSWSDGYKYTDSNIRRILTKNGLFGRRAAKKPLLNKHHLKARLQWCKQMRNNRLEDWQNLVFSDETRVELLSGRSQFVRRPRGAALRYKPKYLASKVPGRQKSLMVFGAIWASGLRVLARVKATMDSKQYIAILENHVTPLLGENNIFQQDNAPCHVSKEVKEYMENSGIAVMPNWPARSPDLNIIENVWDYLKMKCGERSCSSIDELWEILQHEFHSIPNAFLEKLYSSLPSRVDNVLKSRGYPIGY